jgi:hypothetical protein
MKLDEHPPEILALARQLGRVANRLMGAARLPANGLEVVAQGLTVVLRLAELELPICEPPERIDQPFIKRLRLNKAM